SFTVSNFTPVLKVGGVPLKIYLLSRKNMPSPKALAVQAAEIVLELCAFYATFLVLLFFLSLDGAIPVQFGYIGLALIALVAAAPFAYKRLLSPKNLEKLAGAVILRYSRLSPLPFSRMFRSSLSSIVRNRQVLLLSVATSVSAYLLEFIRIYLVFTALGIDVGAIFIVSVWVIGLVLGALPGLPAGLGVVEGGTISALAILGVPAALATSFIMLDRIVALWIPLVFGVAITANLKLKTLPR
ncbi:MAG: lysylphosphatidylglycerol synthase transmembrane domain-containing protein, partial [Candidatus Aenigmatarchaeota archaeon]